MKRKRMMAIIAAAAAVIVCLCYYQNYYLPLKSAREEYIQALEAYNRAAAACNEAADLYNAAISPIAAQNTLLENSIAAAGEAADSGGTPYDAKTLSDLQTAIKEAQKAEVEEPTRAQKEEKRTRGSFLTAAGYRKQTKALVKDTEKIRQRTQKLTKGVQSAPSVPDYTSVVNELRTKTRAYTGSVKALENVTAPSRSAVAKRLAKVDLIRDMQFVTSSHDPEGLLGKDHGYIACIIFLTNYISKSSVEGENLVDKGADVGGAVEIYKTREDAQSRIEALSGSDPDGRHVLVGTLVVRASHLMSESERKEVTDAVTQKLLAAG